MLVPEGRRKIVQVCTLYLEALVRLIRFGGDFVVVGAGAIDAGGCFSANGASAAGIAGAASSAELSL